MMTCLDRSFAINAQVGQISLHCLDRHGTRRCEKHGRIQSLKKDCLRGQAVNCVSRAKLKKASLTYLRLLLAGVGGLSPGLAGEFVQSHASPFEVNLSRTLPILNAHTHYNLVVAFQFPDCAERNTF